MNGKSLLSLSQRLNLSVEALAALGAELRIRRDGMKVDSQVHQGLLDVVAGIKPHLLETASAAEETLTLAFIQAFFRQALDLLENPAREPGWTYEDPTILQAMGQGSRRVVHAIAELAKQRPNLKQALERPGTLLDIGTGVGGFAIEAARTWPALSVVGIDTWEPALTLARKNLSDTNLQSRIKIRSQALQRLQDRDVFTLAWLPGPFIPKEVVENALERVYNALIPEGWIVFGLYASAPDPLGEALTNLRIIRGGGYPWMIADIEARLRALGFEQIESFAPGPPVLFVVGRRPADGSG